ncbi:DinB family protein [Cellulomonas palmilytica]|uniref:DinB family protein n=1 Tax=Cellulomonas palmilytica TaxID=2608402 RepID=UPI001F2363C2|nr:DinB family protein [Cellulomonas palmilytica]UJP41296.1 DinB family protein [Cellulomonas palmilytica]
MTDGTTAPGGVLDERGVLQEYLHHARRSLVWKLDGLSERDARRPLTPTGTNLLGLVKHCAGVEIGYFGEVFGRRWPGPELPWLADDAPANADMWADVDESLESVLGLYRDVWEFADELVGTAPLDTVGRVPWWSAARGSVTLRHVVVHVATEVSRHAGHADIVRELVDGAAGLRPGALNLPDQDADEWTRYVAHLQQVADSFAS